MCSDVPNRYCLRFYLEHFRRACVGVDQPGATQTLADSISARTR